MASPFITVTVNRKGKIVQVRRGLRVAKRKKTTPGKNTGKKFGSTLGLLTIELLEGAHDADRHTKKKGSGGHGKGNGKGRNGGGGTNPCCFRDPGTGNVWCFC
jgi:hypothetical protein